MSIDSISTSSAGPVAPIPTGQGNNQTSINQLPKEVLALILAELLSSDERSISTVSKLWNRVVTELPEPSLKFFGKEAWQKYYNFKIEGKIPPFPKKICQITRSLRRRLKGEREAPTCSLLLMPKGLTLNQLKGLVQNPIMGNSTQFSKDSWAKIFEEFGDKPIEKSYWVLMTGIIEESINKSFNYQKTLVEEKAGSEWQVSKLLEAAVYSLMNHVSSGEGKTHLPGIDGCLYTRCQERIRDKQLIVKGLNPPTRSLNPDSLIIRGYSEVDTHGLLGVAAVRKFSLNKSYQDRQDW